MQIYNEAGEFQAFAGVHVVKMRKQKGELIPRHSHPKENIVFNGISGKVKMTIGQEDYLVESGMSLSFDGDTTISGEFLEDGEVVVVLIQK